MDFPAACSRWRGPVSGKSGSAERLQSAARHSSDEGTRTVSAVSLRCMRPCQATCPDSATGLRTQFRVGDRTLVMDRLSCSGAGKMAPIPDNAPRAPLVCETIAAPRSKRGRVAMRSHSAQ
jgi:hypothetical protein